MRIKLAFAFIILAIFLASCIDPYDRNSVIKLASDNRIIGVWQDLEAEAEFGLKFTKDELFYTYFLGEFILRGTYIADGRTLELQYYDCDSVEECHVWLGYIVTEDTLVLTTSSGDIRLIRVGG